MSKRALATEKENRLKRIQVSPDLILELLKIRGGSCVVDGRRLSFSSNPIPDGARIHRCGVDFHGVIHLTVSDDSFPVVEEAMEIPDLNPQYQEKEL